MRITVKSTDIVRRDPVARRLAQAQFRRRIVQDRTVYTRKQKHRNAEIDR
jgi:hypothetical protein